MATAPVTQPTDETAVFQAITSYDWDHDQEFQAGLRTILTTAPPEKADEVSLRAKCYFYKRKTGLSIDFERFKQWAGNSAGASTTQTQEKDIAERLENSAPAASTSATPGVPEPTGPLAHPNPTGSGQAAVEDEAPPYPKSFNDIVELITSGKPIPGIKEIPDVVNDAPASVSARAERKKPWER